MIGADEFTINDQHGNVIHTSRRLDAHEHMLREIAMLGFKVEGNTVKANRRDVEAPLYQLALRRLGRAA